MRNAFADEIAKLAELDDRIVLLSGDIGNRMFDDFKKKFANRFYNCGVAEANMVSMAAGMAMSGLRPVVYTIAPFLTDQSLSCPCQPARSRPLKSLIVSDLPVLGGTTGASSAPDALANTTPRQPTATAASNRFR